MKETFDRNVRLRRSKDFKSLFKTGDSFWFSPFKVYIVRNALSVTRLGLVIPKKVVSLATHRNRLKRIIRESFRLRENRLGTCDIILLLKKHPMSETTVKSALEAIWSRL